jgi:hypothetical protein
MRKNTISQLLDPVSNWLMYCGILLFAILYYLDIVKVLNYNSTMFWVSLSFIVCSGLLFAGGLLRQNGLILWSAIVLTLLTGYQAVIFGRAGIDYNFAVFVIMGSVLVHFIVKAKANTSK